MVFSASGVMLMSFTEGVFNISGGNDGGGSGNNRYRDI
jgi:hypothetical protein